MNEHEVQNLLTEAAAGPVDVAKVDPMTILRAGRRRVARRRKAAAAIAGGAAALLAVTAAVGIPLALGDQDQTAPGGAAPDDLPTAPVDEDFLAQWTRADGADCPLPDDQTDEQQRIAAANNAVLFDALADLDAEPRGTCLTTRPDYDGFYYSDDQTAYMTEEAVFFGGDPADWAYMVAGFWETGGVDYEAIMWEEECTYPDTVTCTWDDTEAGRVLLIEGVRNDFLNPDTEADGSAPFPVVSAFLFREDVAVQFDFALHFESDRTGPTVDQIVDLITALPLNQDAPEVEPPAATDLAADLAAAIATELPGAVVDTASADLVRLSPDIATYGGPVYGTEATHMLFVLAELESGETVRFFLQAERVEDAVDAAEVPAETAAQCPSAECEITTDDSGSVSVHRTIDGDRPSLTAFASPAGDGWAIGVGVEPADGTEAPPVDLATLDAILDAIR
ncbi:hypothetical protein [Glycomyces dulcitolivorans]|uniref:hypothetical protein n=1 Tax=Glycomyces dulcitolivorans TaxID=2200759 RepID=UPI000DD31D06|nr:hypothetical protein [Glycomyces dulcitolivorans]